MRRVSEGRTRKRAPRSAPAASCDPSELSDDEGEVDQRPSRSKSSDDGKGSPNGSEEESKEDSEEGSGEDLGEKSEEDSEKSQASEIEVEGSVGNVSTSWRNQLMNSTTNGYSQADIIAADEGFGDINSKVGVICNDLNRRPALSATSSASSASRCSTIQLEINDFVACVPTLEAQAQDEAVGYRLPFSIGRVVDKKVSGVVVTWMYSRNIDGRWYLWDENVNGKHSKRKGRKLRRDDLEWASILRDNDGVLKIKFCADKTLTKVSISRLKKHPELKMPENDWRSLFRNPV